MLFNHKYKGSSAVASSSGKMGISFAPDTLREPTYFIGNLHDKLNFREAISALHHVVVADFKFKPSNKEDYKAKKEREKKLRSAKNKAGKLENEIAALEEEIKALDEVMLDAAAFKKAQEERDVYGEYQQKQDTLDAKMAEWEKTVELVEELGNQ